MAQVVEVDLGQTCLGERGQPHTAAEVAAPQTRPARADEDQAVVTGLGVPVQVVAEAVDHGLQAYQFERKTEASLLSRAADLHHDLLECYPRERVIEPFHERYSDERRALRDRTTRDAEL
jgi:hypothetical protein